MTEQHQSSVLVSSLVQATRTSRVKENYHLLVELRYITIVNITSITNFQPPPASPKSVYTGWPK